MKKNRGIKIILSIIILFAMFTILGQGLVLAVENRNDQVELKINTKRWVKDASAYTEKRAYALNTGSDHPVFQILSTSGTNVGQTNYLCLNAEKGATWYNNSIGTAANYNVSYDLVDDKDTINSSLTNAYKTATGANYTQIMWILDQIPIGTNFNVDTVLAKAGIKKGPVDMTGTINAYFYDYDNLTVDSVFAQESVLNNNLYGNPDTLGGYYYIDTNGNQQDVKLSKELIEVVEQAALWYFTNGGTTYNCLTKQGDVTPKPWLKYSDDPSVSIDNWSLLSNYEITGRDGTVYIGKMLQEQACILYNYLIDGANAAKTAGYTSNAAGSLKITPTNPTLTEEGSNYKIGPMKITSTNSSITGGLVVTTGTGTDITSQATTTGITKTSPTANTDFYVTVPKSSVNGSVIVKVNGTTSSVEKKLRIGNIGDNETNAEQAIVEVNSTPKNISAIATATITKQFDLALRKVITGVKRNGNLIELKSEVSGAGTANRVVTPNGNKIPDTGTYKHRKDPIIVSEGDIVTYKIHIYNEGEVEGYASKIIDQLPTGLQSVLSTGETITSTLGNKYTVTYDSTNNKITLESSSKKKINAYNSASNTLSEDTITLEAKVNQTAASDGTTKHYLTNIAYIAEGYDTENNQVVTADRDGNESKTTEVPNKTADQLNNANPDDYRGKTSNQSVNNDTTNNYYYEGEQDDDDFEKVVVLPKQFDLALRKFITLIKNSNEISEISSEREPVIGAWKYDNNQTLEKSHPKNKLRVSKGDIVVYTIRVYNEGEINGYASEVTDYLPEGLTLNPNSDINTENGWTADGQKITTTKLSTQLINAYDKATNTLDYKDLQVSCIVNENATSENLKNIAAITGAKDENGNVATDRDSQPEQVNTSTYNPTNPDKGRGEQDDDDFEDLKLKELDLALRKFITKISKDGNFENTSTTTTYNRAPSIDSSKLKAGTENTAIYNHSKKLIDVNVGDYVLYTIRVYNEGDVDGYASQITDYLPDNLDFVDSTDEYIKSINDNWEQDTTNAKKIVTKSTAANATTKLLAYDAEKDDGKGSALKYVDVQVICKVNRNTPLNKKLTNIAEISEYKDEEGTVVNPDRDSTSNNLNYPENPETYKDDETDKSYVPGQEDDDDFEKVIVKERKIDLALTKFITAVSKDDKIENGEYLTPNKNIGSKTNEYIRATVADTTGLKAGTSTNATYTAKKNIEPLAVEKNSYILYNIRVYNEGEVDVFAGEITDYLPENLEFVDGDFNEQYGWEANGQTVKTTYLSSKNGADKILKAFDKENDDGKGSGMDYKDLPVLCKVSDKAESGKKMVNTAEITKYENKDGEEISEDIDSTPENKEEKNVEERSEDDDDYEVVIINSFDLSLRKFITEIDTVKSQDDKSVSPTKITDRVPKLAEWKKDEPTTIEKKHPKNVLKVGVGDIITYTLRVYNEGGIDGYAEKITDDIPEYLEYLPNHSTNKEYKWVMYDKNGKETSNVKDAVKIVTDYTSRANGAEKNLLKAFDKNAKISDTNPAYLDVKVAFKVKDPKSNKTVIVNKAQISEDADKNGNPVEDVDSTPDKWNDGEDDQDYENVSVEYFDLSLLKYVTKAIVTENGKTKTTKTGNNGSSKDITPKVELHRKKLNKTTVKFEYEIKITNEGDIAGYAKEITDYVPKGLKFYKQDNKGWKDEGNNVISTKLLEKTLLQPGESATVKVVLRWINGANNLSLKTNTAEISEDYNDKGVPDRDSTPDNKKKGEDDIDDAPVLLTISTGLEDHPVEYALGALAILTVLGTGVILIKKYVL